MSTLKRRMHVVRPITFADLSRTMRGMLDRTINPPESRGNSSGYTHPAATRNRDWDDGVSFRKALEMLDAGWPEGVKDALDGLNINAPDAGAGGGFDLDVAGDFLAVESYISGQPECMYRKEAGESPRRVRLIANAWYTCATHAETAKAYAAATAAYASGLMQAGYDVAVTVLYAADASDGKDTDVAVIPVLVKEFSQEPDASKLAFMTHPAFMRRCLFAYAEADVLVHEQLTTKGCYGHMLQRPLTEAECKEALAGVCSDERMLILPEIRRGTSRDWREWSSLFNDLKIETQDADGDELDLEEEAS